MVPSGASRAVAGDRDALAVDDRERLLGLPAVAEIAERHAPASRRPADLVVARLEEATAVRREDRRSRSEREAVRLAGAARGAVGHAAGLRGAVAVDDEDVR